MLGLFFFIMLLIGAFMTARSAGYAAPRARSGAGGGLDRAHPRCDRRLLRRDLFRDLPDGLLLLAPPRNRRDVRPHIVLNALALHADGSGVQTYCRELLRALPPEIDADLTAVVQRTRAGELPLRAWRACADGLRRRAPHDREPAQHRRRPISCTRSMSTCRCGPARRRSRRCTTCRSSTSRSAFGWARRVGKQVTTRRSIRRADAVIAVSAFTAERVQARFGRDSHVVLEAPGPGFAPPPPTRIDAGASSLLVARAVRPARRQPRTAQGRADPRARGRGGAGCRSCSPAGTSSPSTRRRARALLGQVDAARSSRALRRGDGRSRTCRATRDSGCRRSKRWRAARP